MEMIADILLVAGALGAGFYCFVLARRLSRFNDLENGVGGAVAVLSAQVDDLTRTLERAQNAATQSSGSLDQLTDRAEAVAKRLELLVASMHDLPEAAVPPTADTAEPEAVFVRRGKRGELAK
jgi:methyl-accepting chemotaxis protein